MKDYERQQFREAFAKKEEALEEWQHLSLASGESLPMDERADLEWRCLVAERAYDEANSEYETLIKNLLGASPVSEVLKGMVV